MIKTLKSRAKNFEKILNSFLKLRRGYSSKKITVVKKIINDVATKLTNTKKSTEAFDETKYERIWVSRQNAKIRRESNFKDLNKSFEKLLSFGTFN